MFARGRTHSCAVAEDVGIRHVSLELFETSKFFLKGVANDTAHAKNLSGECESGTDRCFLSLDRRNGAASNSVVAERRPRSDSIGQ